MYSFIYKNMHSVTEFQNKGPVLVKAQALCLKVYVRLNVCRGTTYA